MHSLEEIIKGTGVTIGTLMCLYPYGSRVYGTVRPDSDYDFIVVHDGDRLNSGVQYDFEPNYTVHVYHESEWKQRIEAYEIQALECLSLMTSTEFTLPEINKPLLRASISAKVSNSWVKAKKKITVEDDYLTGIKSLFHCFRIAMFGQQIARHGRVVDFTEATPLWKEEFEPMLETRPEWTDLHLTYKPRINALMTEFRKYAEKM